MSSVWGSSKSRVAATTASTTTDVPTDSTVLAGGDTLWTFGQMRTPVTLAVIQRPVPC